MMGEHKMKGGHMMSDKDMEKMMSRGHNNPDGKPYPKDKKSRSFVSGKIKKLMKEGKKQSQAVAIALSMARKKK